MRHLLNRFFPPERPAWPDAAPCPEGDEPVTAFRRSFADALPNRVLEAGTAQAVPGVSSHHMYLFPGIDRSRYTMIDIKPGLDVDVVADLHDLPQDWTGRFDAFIAGAVFEHLQRPWIAAREVARVLAPGGVCYVLTHQTFPLHTYPGDYFRFSADALALLFRDAGLEVLACTYKGRTKITLPPDMLDRRLTDHWNAAFPSYATVHLSARKPAQPNAVRTTSTDSAG